jgi:hypothetical protein
MTSTLAIPGKAAVPARRRLAPPPGEGDRTAGLAVTTQIVANQESQAVEKEQRNVCAVSLHPACASSRRCSRPAGRGEIAECVAKRASGADRTSSPMAYGSNSAASDVSLVRFALRIVRAEAVVSRPRRDVCWRGEAGASGLDLPRFA